jgi:hypothetical protein
MRELPRPTIPGFRFEAEPEWFQPFRLSLSLHPGNALRAGLSAIPAIFR